jgi:thiosulfate reductase cytochrome b subunit
MTKTYVHTLPARFWHWTNALGFMLLSFTGLQIRYTDLFSVMPFEWAVKFHNWIGLGLIGIYFIWFLYYMFSERGSSYHPELDARKFFRDAFAQTRFYSYGIFRGEPNPHKIKPYAKFNPLQKLMYTIVMMIIVPVQFVTGLMLWDGALFARWIDAMGGIRIVSTVHMLIFIFFVTFMLIHVYLSSLGHTPSAHFKAMFTGYEEEHDEPPGHEQMEAAR